MTVEQGSRRAAEGAMIALDAPSTSMRRRWAKRISDGKSKPVIVYVGGQWSIDVLRGRKRTMRVNIG